LRLVCERESEIEAFRPREYWTIEVEFATEAGDRFTARLSHLDGKKLDRFDLDSEAKARDAANKILAAGGFTVASVERREVRRNPFPPFTTSTLQQEASRKLGFGASRTMQMAQRLYEGIELDGDTVGLITYMRTDGVQIAAEAIAGARQLIGTEFGGRYVPPEPRVYRSPAKNAQEAHEAIRPTDLARKPGDVARFLDSDQRRLYELIWKRTVASQMASALLDQVSVDIADPSGRLRLHATGSVVVFDGFLKLYQEDRDDTNEEESESRRLPKMRDGERLARGAVDPSQHFTQPPPRYSEASLVKKLEELGIGRPSTYASIIQVLQDRNYVRLDKRRFLPEDRGRLVTAFLSSFFERYVEYNFTAQLEDQLDDVSGGRIDWKELLRNFWRDFSSAVDGTKDLTIKAVLEALDAELGPHFFPEDGSGSGRDPRLCQACAAGRLSLKLGRFGAFIGCSNYPECRYTRAFGVGGETEGEPAGGADILLGNDPATGLSVTVKKGPYGHYIQLGDSENGNKPKRVALPRSIKPADVDLETALGLLALPREVGRHPETGETIIAGIGRFGPYLKHGSSFVSLPADDDVLNVGLNRAVTLLAEAKTGQRRGPQLLREVGPHPEGGTVGLYRGRYGPYVSHEKVYASLPKGADPDSFPLDQALALLTAQKAKGKGRKPVRKAAAAASNGTAKPARRAAAKPATKAASKKNGARPAAKAASRQPPV